jgi:hypothetical protein
MRCERSWAMPSTPSRLRSAAITSVTAATMLHHCEKRSSDDVAGNVFARLPVARGIQSLHSHVFNTHEGLIDFAATQLRCDGLP